MNEIARFKFSLSPGTRRDFEANSERDSPWMTIKCSSSGGGVGGGGISATSCANTTTRGS